MPALYARIRAANGIGAAALAFAILTAARSGEVSDATWPEIDWDRRVWTVPPGRMKAKREHSVPLSEPALAILREMHAIRAFDDGLIFPAQKLGAPLSDMSPAAVLKRLGRGDITPHGFRSAFRDWCGEHTDYPRELAEEALAHASGDKVEAAYRRGTAIEKRRAMMRDWADYLRTPPKVTTGTVVELRPRVMTKPAPSPPPEQTDPLAKIAAMVAELRARERDPAIASAYRAAIDRLQGLAYRIHTRPRIRVYGLPDKAGAHHSPKVGSGPRRPARPHRRPAPARETAPEAPRPAGRSDQEQRARPLGPVPAVVKTRKPRR